jgi:hypothetical protein
MAEIQGMSEKIQSKKKVLVPEAFGTLFNKRDYPAAELAWPAGRVQAPIVYL